MFISQIQTYFVELLFVYISIAYFGLNSLFVKNYLLKIVDFYRATSLITYNFTKNKLELKDGKNNLKKKESFRRKI